MRRRTESRGKAEEKRERSEKRIALVLNTLSSGGAERMASNLSLALSEMYEIDLVLDSRIAVSYPFSGRVRSLGMQHPEKRGELVY